jgi:hypothetical protein
VTHRSGSRCRPPGGTATIAAHLDTTNFADAIEIANLPDQVRGYEHIKLTRATAYRAQLHQRLDTFTP